MFCRAILPRKVLVNVKTFVNCKNSVNCKNLKNEILKKNYIYQLEQHTMKSEFLKVKFNNYKCTITNIEDNQDLINDLYNATYDKSNYNSIYVPASHKLRICNIINKHISEYEQDQEVLELFGYILYIYKCI